MNKNDKRNDEQELARLAKKHNILRLHAENGLTCSEAIRFINKFSGVIEKCSFPRKYYSLLK